MSAWLPVWSDMLIVLAPILVIVKAAVPVTCEKVISPLPPTVKEPLPLTTPWSWATVAEVLTMAPCPAWPMPTIEVKFSAVDWPLRSIVPPWVTTVLPTTEPSALGWASLRMPWLTVVVPV